VEFSLLTLFLLALIRIYVYNRPLHMIPARELSSDLEDSDELPTQQQIEHDLGVPLGSCCAPTAFYIEGRLLGYPSGQLAPTQFVGGLDFDNDRGTSGWVRPKLSEDLRTKYGLTIVSWNTTKQPQDIELMRKRGYLRTKREIEFFRNVVQGRGVLELVDGGYRVVAAMAPGFATNQQIHTVVLSSPEESDAGFVHVTDPDGRNQTNRYTRQYILKTLQPGGACSIVLPAGAPS
jgi:hypothetical protein